MKRFLATFALLISTISASHAATDPLEPCRIQSTNTTNHIRVGWPVDEDILRSIGQVKILVLVVDFVDAPRINLNPEQIRSTMGLTTVTNYYVSISNGLFKPSFTIYPEYVRMPERSTHYGQKLEVDEVVNGEWESHHMTHDALDQVANSVKISDFDAAIVVVGGGESLSGRIALATAQDPGLDKHSSGEIHNTILTGIQAFSTEGIRPWEMIVHEINHLMGVPDLYLYEADGWWQGKSVGPFGMQGYLRGTNSSDSIGWNRWLKGWIPEKQILCIDTPKNLSNIKMNPPGSKNSNYELVIIRQSTTVVYVVEALKKSGFESSTYENSILVYKVDSSVESGYGPITIIPKRTKTTTAPLSPSVPDWIRFEEAPITTFEQVYSNDFLFRNVKYLNGNVIFSFFTGENALTQSKVKAKTISCKVGKKILKIKGFNPTCPKK